MTAPGEFHPFQGLPAVLLAGALASALACTGAGDGPEPTRWESLPTAALQEELRIDGYEHDLVPIGGPTSASEGIAVRADGAIAVRQRQDGVIRVFDADGRSVKVVGGPGEGPGEFSVLWRVGWLADTLWAADGRLRHMTLFGPVDSALNTFRLPGEAIPSDELETAGVPRFPYAYVMERLPDGALLAQLGLSVGSDVPARFEDRLTWAVLDRDGVIRRIVATVPIGEVQLNTPRGEAFALPFPNATVADASIEAGRLVFSAATLDGDPPFITTVALDLTGDTIFSRRDPFEPREIPSAVRDSVMSRFPRDLPTPTIFPPLDDLVIGNDGTVWLGMIEDETGRPYRVYEPDGAPLGNLVLPPGARLAAAERERVWVVEKDELGVESIVRYPVTWP